jgi:hypothetical protein
MKVFCGEGDGLSSTIGLCEVMGNNALRVMHSSCCFNEYGEADENYKSTFIQFSDVPVFLGVASGCSDVDFVKISAHKLKVSC